MIPVAGENYKLLLYKRVENSPYEWETAPDIYFKGRPANTAEKKNYRITQGVSGSSSSVYVICSNLPKNIKPKDKIKFLGKEWVIESVGYYFMEDLVINASIMSDEYIISRCPKGISLQ